MRCEMTDTESIQYIYRSSTKQGDVDKSMMQAETDELEISEEQALMVIKRLEDNHDATVGC